MKKHVNSDVVDKSDPNKPFVTKDPFRRRLQGKPAVHVEPQPRPSQEMSTSTRTRGRPPATPLPLSSQDIQTPSPGTLRGSSSHPTSPPATVTQTRIDHHTEKAGSPPARTSTERLAEPLDPYSRAHSDEAQSSTPDIPYISASYRSLIYLYISLLLGLPYLYFSRVARVLESAYLPFGDFQVMASMPDISGRVSDAEILLQDLAQPGYTPDVFAIWSFKETWGQFVANLLKEWETLNIISGLFISSVQPRQIQWNLGAEQQIFFGTLGSCSLCPPSGCRGEQYAYFDFE
ncbi:hypothetical protein EV715DRAFT_266596 [Schizophyllum commune]